ncbi:MAG: sialidase family protein [Clostridia bacterium]|nr:sialidase family protein [Clostridia bacterium]
MSYKIKVISRGTVYRNKHSKFGYAAWPSIAKADNGDLLVVASGMRTAHVDPFGKVILMRSRDMGETWSNPMIALDTPLDDRDAGILNLGGGNYIVTSFNNTREIQKNYIGLPWTGAVNDAARIRMIYGYLDCITDEEEEKYYSSSFNISRNDANSFEEFVPIPITSPHGPMKTPDGRIIWVGKTHHGYLELGEDILCYEIHDDLSYEKIGTVAKGDDFNERLVEPHCIAVDDKHFISHIRIQNGCFTVWQSESFDGGYTWTEPVELGVDGSPPHLLMCREGRLISTYGKRSEPFGISAMISEDSGKTWETDIPLAWDGIDSDLGYPCSIELGDGSIFTVYYAKLAAGEVPGIQYIRWSFE